MSGGFQHGIHPAGNKGSTSDLPLRRVPFGERFVLPLGQHIGAPSRALVHKGEQVLRGQRIAEPGGFVSTSLHAPVTGTVVEVGPRRHPFGHIAPAIELQADPYADQSITYGERVDPFSLSPQDFVSQVQLAGLVGLGGAAFPSHVKYAIKEGMEVERLVINGAECEPYLTCDHRVMVERPEAVIRGIRILAARLGVRSSHIGIEKNKPDAAEALREVLGDDDSITVQPLDVKYPQGAEKMLIYALFGETVPAGKLPLNLGIVVNNVGTMAALADWFDQGKPLIERPLTVAGPGIREPANLMVPLGTSVADVLALCGGLLPETRTVVMGGPMMGQPLSSLDVPIIKGTSGLLALTAESSLPQEYACLRCGRCLEACPNFLNPSRLARTARAGRLDLAESAYVMDCMECGACSYSCPSGIPIVQLIRAAKSQLRSRKAAAK